MINMLLGSPGSGKSYEAVAYHLIPELLNGRKVITDLPVFKDKLKERYPLMNLDLLDIREPRLNTKTGVTTLPFSSMEDYADKWRHPESGSGPLYIIDECHFKIPKGSTPVAISNWFSMHRHESADVLLITQSYGKIEKTITDLVQIVYRVRKNIALGSETTYVRKVYDGLRGEEVNQTIRKYNSNIFPLYKSHTQGGGKELSTQDVKPIWKHWTFYAAIPCIIFVVYQLIAHGNPLTNLMGAKPIKTADKPVTVEKKEPQKVPVPVREPSIINSNILEPQKLDHPFSGYEFKLVGCLASKNRSMCVIGLAHNGIKVAEITDTELRSAGYGFKLVNSCLGVIQYGPAIFYSICDNPHVTATGNLTKMTGK